MVRPEFTIRIEFFETGDQETRKWRIALGGEQRGGMAYQHNTMPVRGIEMGEHLEHITYEVEQLLHTYVCSISSLQLELFRP